MLKAFVTYIKEKGLLSAGDRVVLAVSGGADSMTMLHLFQQLDYDFVVAHCNFHLRGAESDQEEVFIHEYCHSHDIELHIKHFETKEQSLITGDSIEMTARQLRYDWFSELLDSLDRDYVITAHHQDDLVETMLINLSRGTGIKGLAGISPKNGRVIRPLLFTTRRHIIDYAMENDISFMNDSSNEELNYGRNMIRHRIIPLFEKINAGFRKNVLKTANILRDTEKIYMQRISQVRKELIKPQGHNHIIPIEPLKQTEPVNTFLFELLRPFGFKGSQTLEIAGALDAEAGKVFLSKTHKVVKDRDNLIITRLKDYNDQLLYIEEECRGITHPIHLVFEVFEKEPDFQFSDDPYIADIDYDKLLFPLTMKKWEAGEYFRPLGMTGFKKISNFFIDEKLSLPEKEATHIIYSGKDVVYIIGRRIDDRFKITRQTKTIFRIISHAFR